MSYAKKNSKKKGNTTTANSKKGAGTMKTIDKEFKNAVIISFLKVVNTKDLNDAMEILASGDDLAVYVAGICKSATSESVEDYIINTDYVLSDGEYISCMSVLNKAVKAIKVQKTARKETKCTKLFDTINSLMQKADDDTIEMSSVIAQVMSQVSDNMVDISIDDATRIALSIVLNAVVCKTIDICDESGIVMSQVVAEDTAASKTKEEKTEETKADDNESIEGLIDSVTTIFIDNCMDMWINQYGESRRNEIAAAARQAVGMVVRDTTDLVTLKNDPDKFVQDNTFKVLSLLSDIMKKGAQVAVTGESGLDSDLVRKLLAAVVKDSLGLMKSPVATLLLGLAPSSVTEKVLALSVEDRDLVDTKRALEEKGFTNQTLKDAIEDPKHEIRVELVKKFKDIGIMGIIKSSKEVLKDEIIKGINKLVESRTNTHISLSKKEIDQFADRLAGSIIGDVEVLNSNTDAHKTEEQNPNTRDKDGLFRFQEGSVIHDETREKCNELITEIFRNARKKAGLTD